MRRLMFIAVLAWSGPAWAEEPERAPEPTCRWYGWRLAVADAAWLAGAMAVEDEAAYAFMVPYAVVAPVAHGFHDQWQRAAGSFMLRVTLPLVGLQLFGGRENVQYGDCPALLGPFPCRNEVEYRHAGRGLLIGAAVAAAIDYAWSYAWDD